VPPHECAERVIYIVDFWSRCISGAEQRGKRAHKVEDRTHHVAMCEAHVVGAQSCLMALHVDFFFSHDLIP
jgi:hypothetical protein